MRGGKEAPTKPKGRPKKQRENEDIHTRIETNTSPTCAALRTVEQFNPTLSPMDTDDNNQFIDVD